jgi:hypothetical protein
MYQAKVVITLALLLLTTPAHAVPSLIPLLPVIGILLAKGVLLLSSIFFLVLSYFKSNKKLFLGLGIILLLLFIVMMVFVKNV